MKSYFKFLSRNKLYTCTNLLGLSISLMFVILIANYVTDSLTIDSNVKKADRIYAMGNENYMATGYWTGQHLKARYPEIEAVCGIIGGFQQAVYSNDKEYFGRCLYADTVFFDMFSIRLIEGNSKDVLASKDNAVVSVSFATELFGKDNPVGKSIRINEKDFVIAGVMSNIKKSILPEADVVLNFMNVNNKNIINENMDNAGSTAMFLLAKEGVDLRKKTDEFLVFFKTYFWPYSGGAWKEVRLTPFNDIYFSSPDNGSINNGNWFFVLVLMLVGGVILLFSVLNYINLTVAQTGFRAKEMATRRLFGSSRGALFGKLILESFLMSVSAFVIGFLLAISVESFANSILQSNISLLKDIDGIYLPIYAGLIIFVAIVSGVVPAWIISNFQPIEVVRGTFRRKTSMVYSKILITFQNVITITFIGVSITMLWQVNHMINAPMGYDCKNIIDISTWSGFKSYEQIKTTVNELKQLSFVKEVGQGEGTPLQGGNNNTLYYGTDRMVSFQAFYGDTAFYQIFNLKTKSDFALSSGRWYFNEYAFKQLEIDENTPVVKLGKKFEDAYEIAGVVNDFQVRSILNEKTAVMCYIIKNYEALNIDRVRRKPWNIVVKISDNIDKNEAMDQVTALVERITGAVDETDIDYMETRLKFRYEEQRRTSDIMLIFTFIAIVISSLGMVAMSTYFIQQRRMEMAIRKVFGSTDKEVLFKLIGTFMLMMAFSFVIAIPILWWCIEYYLSDFVYRIPLSPLIFLGAGAVISLIAFLAVYWQSRRAADENPVNIMKR